MKLSYLALTSFLSSTATSVGVAAEDEPSASLRTGTTTNSATLDHHHHHRLDASSHDHDYDHHGYHHHQKHPHPHLNSNAFIQVKGSDAYKRLQVRSEHNKLRNSNSNSNHEGADEATKAAAASVVVEEEEACTPAMSKEELQQLVLLEEDKKTVIMNKKMKMHLDSGFLTTSSCTSKEKICIQQVSSSTTGICIDKHTLLDANEDSTTTNTIGGGSGGYADPSSGVDSGLMMMDTSSQVSLPSSLLEEDVSDHHRSLQDYCDSLCISGRPSVYDRDEYLYELIERCVGYPGSGGPCPDEFKDIPANCWNTAYVEFFDEAFSKRYEFNEPLYCWDTSSGLNFDFMFAGAEEFNQDINMWDVSKAISMRSMFYEVKKFSQNLNTWETGKVTDMSYMFMDSYFDGDINSWDTGNVTTLKEMFYYASYFNKPVSGWNTGKVTDMCYTFLNAPNFNQDVNTWDVSKVKYMTGTFEYYIFEPGYEEFYSKFNSPVYNWDTSNLLNSASMFANSVAFNQPVSSWDVSKATHMGHMFMKVPKFNECLTSWAFLVQPDVNVTGIFTETACMEQSPQAGIGPWCQSVGEGCPATLDLTPSSPDSKPAPTPTQSSNIPTMTFSPTTTFSPTMEETYFPTNTFRPSQTIAPSPFNTMDESSFDTKDEPTLVPTMEETLFPTNTVRPSLTMAPSPFNTMDESSFNTMDESSFNTMDESSFNTMDSTTMSPTTEPTSSSGSCVNTEFKLIPNEETGIEMFCGGVLNQLFAPPQDVEELKEKCNTRIKSTDPNNDMVLVSEVCPTFCDFDTCCSVDGDFEFLLNDGKTKRCGGLLNTLIEDSTAEGKAALAEQCAAELEAVSGGTAVVEDICTGLCRKGCEVVDCNNKRPDQFLLIPDDSNGNKLNCDDFLKDMSTVEKKIVCKEKISIFNVKKDKILKKKQTPKKTCPLYCSNRCKKQLALSEAN